jgi:hypothetical protein
MNRKAIELESEIEKYFDWAVESIGGRTYKFKSPTRRGVSDRIACLPNGHTWFVELKRPKGGYLSPMQEIFAEDMAALKQKYTCLWTKEQIMQWIADL